MARTIKEIQEEMITAKNNEIVLAELKDTTTVDNLFTRFWDYLFGTNRSTSKVAIWRLWIYIISFSIWTLESVFDVHVSHIDQKLSKLKPHTRRWYRNMALAFQYGFALLEDSPKFDNLNKTIEEIEASKIIKYAAVTEADKESRLILKIATEQNNFLTPVTATQYDAFKAYVGEFKDAGVKVTIINYLPDRLRLNIRLDIDPLLLDSNGINRITGATPVNIALHQFMKELPFDGLLSLQKLEEKLLKVDGVNDLKIDLAETAWIDAMTNSYGNWESIDIDKIPVSGYFAINLTEDNETKSTISYV